MSLKFELDNRSIGHPALGLIVLKTDETLEPELASIFTNTGVVLHHSRIPCASDVTPDTLKLMEANLPDSISKLPDTDTFVAFGYACTSGATVIGRQKIAACFADTFPDKPSTDPISAVVTSCKALDVTRLGLITPYVPSVSTAMVDLLAHEGMQVERSASFEQVEDPIVARISERSTLDAILSVGGSSDVDAVFASCTNLRTLGIIDEAEKLLNKPVISSNLALAWHLAKLGGIDTRKLGPGMIFAR